MVGQELLDSVLRISPEPCCYLGENEVHRLLIAEPLAYYQFVRNELEDLALGRASMVLPAKQIFGDDGGKGDFRVMPCVTQNRDRLTKTVKIVGTNIRQQIVPDQITVGKACAIHPRENFITHIFEACLLSSARTGVCAAIAAGLLAPSSRSLTVVGAGRVGYYGARYIATALQLERISVADINQERAENCARLLAAELPGVECLAVASPMPKESGIVFLATTSREPLCHPQETAAALVISVGADTDFQHELAPEWPAQADIFVDTMDSLAYGDLKAWGKGKLLGGVTDLLTLLRDGVRPTQKRSLFISTGSALFDNLTIAYLLEKLNGNLGDEILKFPAAGPFNLFRIFKDNREGVAKAFT